jgi:hypothetical protein
MILRVILKKVEDGVAIGRKKSITTTFSGGQPTSTAFLIV